MKKWFIYVSGFFIFTCTAMLPSCSTNESVIGILVIKVIDADENPVVAEQVFLALTYEQMKTKDYFASSWTNKDGNATFIDLTPLYYWYDTEHWEDWGAIQVYAGIEQLITLRVNTPQP